MKWPVDTDGVLSAVIATEGGFVNDPADPAGATNMGITLATLSNWFGRPCTPGDVQALTVAEAKRIYAANFIRAPHFDAIANPRLLYILVDTGILFGPGRATQMLQAAVKVPVDGFCGTMTVDAANGAADVRAVINAIAGARVKAHAARVSADPTQLRFLVGWLNRALAFIE